MMPVSALSQQIWDLKYRLKDASGEPLDTRVEDTWRRVAKALAEVEQDPETWEARFFDAMRDYRMLPAGRILAGAGSDRQVTLFNCFVMGTIPDDMSGIFEHLKQAALTLQQGGGIGYDFSTLRPRGALVKGVGADASGPLSFMDVWDAMCRTIMSAGHRRGAMMATLRCDHPDIEAFIDAKAEPGRLRMFNLSVLVSDAFMQAVEADDTWDLTFDGTVYRVIQARALWDKIMRATYAYAEPGVIFIDRINRLNNLWYCEEIAATNPCGEQPLPPYGACLLGSINLARLVQEPFSANASLDLTALQELAAVAVRLLDNAIDVSRFPLPEQRAEALAKRRIGLGITGLADALAMVGLRYGSEDAVARTEAWLAAFRRAAYAASIDLASEKGAFPLFDKAKFLQGESVRGLGQDLQDAIAEKGIRNALVTSVAPTGTISLLADNVSSGIEPIFSLNHRRSIRSPQGRRQEETVSDYAFRLFRHSQGEESDLPSALVTAQELEPEAHLAMQAAVQKYIDSSVSKTINLPAAISYEDFADVYRQAYARGCKGCTTYRPNKITGAVLTAENVTQDGKNEEERQPPALKDEAGVIYMTQPLDRPASLPGKTYKLRWPESDHAIYITLNDIIQDGRRRPFEIFINSKNMDHYAWTLALTRMISAVFRRGGDVSFVVEELKAVFDPRGGAWMNRRYVPSLLAAIGDVIEKHMVDIGFLPKNEAEPRLPAVVNSPSADAGVGDDGLRTLRQCPKCGSAALWRQEGCDVCADCRYSKCS